MLLSAGSAPRQKEGPPCLPWEGRDWKRMRETGEGPLWACIAGWNCDRRRTADADSAGEGSADSLASTRYDCIGQIQKGSLQLLPATKRNPGSLVATQHSDSLERNEEDSRGRLPSSETTGESPTRISGCAPSAMTRAALSSTPCCALPLSFGVYSVSLSFQATTSPGRWLYSKEEDRTPCT